MAVGIGHARIQRWCGAGRLTRVHAGVYAVGYRHGEPLARRDGGGAGVRRRRTCSAMNPPRRCGAGGVGPRFRRSAPRGRGAGRASGRTARARSRARTGRAQLGVPVTSPERTIREIESRLTRKQFTRIVKDAWLERRLDKAAVTRLLGYAAEPTRSEFEEAFRRFCRRFGLPKPLTLATRARIRGRRAVPGATARGRARRLGVPRATGWRSPATASVTPTCSTLAMRPSGSPGSGCTRPRSAKPRG